MDIYIAYLHSTLPGFLLYGEGEDDAVARSYGLFLKEISRFLKEKDSVEYDIRFLEENLKAQKAKHLHDLERDFLATRGDFIRISYAKEFL